MVLILEEELHRRLFAAVELPLCWFLGNNVKNSHLLANCCGIEAGGRQKLLIKLKLFRL